MKFVAVLALVLVVVSASEYFKQPKFPCAYKITATGFRGSKIDVTYVIEVNGRYFKLQMTYDKEYDILAVIRPDIGGDGNVTLVETEVGADYCYVEPILMQYANYFVNVYGNLLMYVDGKSWEHKKSETYKGKKCDHYYDDDGRESIYVYDDHIYAISEKDGDDFIFEYEWEAPMEDFALKEKDFPACAKQNSKIAEVPSLDYVFCAACSIKVAFVAVLATFLAALF